MTSDGEPRIAPLPREEWTDEIVATMAPLTPPEGSAVLARRKEMGGSPVVNALATLLRHPALAASFFRFNRHLLYESSLTERERELAILRVASRRSCDYEWAQHVAIAGEIGITEAEIDALRAGGSGPERAGFEADLVAAVDQLVDDACIAGDTWDALRAARDEQWLMDLVFTVGGYETLAMAFRSFAIPLDPGIEKYR